MHINFQYTNRNEYCKKNPPASPFAKGDTGGLKISNLKIIYK